MKTPTIILGVDPGTNILGFGVLKTQGKREMEVKEINTLHLQKLPDHYAKLRTIFLKMQYLINEYTPDIVAVEAPFFGKNVQSMLKLGRAQGVIMAAALACDIPVIEYAPKKIKMAITGNGNASKEQVSYVLQQMLKITNVPKELDATDGLATAVCHALQGNSNGLTSNKGSSWKAFLQNNPHRLGKK